MQAIRSVFLFSCFLFLPNLAFAHEVYVLPHSTILHDVAIASPNPFTAIEGHYGDFFLWGFIVVMTVLAVFGASVFGTFERWCYPFLAKIKRYAAPTARVTLGVCLVACAYNQALFGPELPFADWAGGWSGIVSLILAVCGLLIALGILARFATIPVFIIFAAGIGAYGVYMLNYANYVGELVFVLIAGSGSFSMLRQRESSRLRHVARRLEPYAFVTLRICFGVAIIFASYYAKFLHSELALDTIADYHLTHFFRFDPLFTVLGAFIIESLIGLFFIVGFEIRWTALFFLFWLALSLLYFGEAVWPHLILLGLNLTFLMHGYDRYSLEGHFFKKRLIEPVF